MGSGQSRTVLSSLAVTSVRPSGLKNGCTGIPPPRVLLRSAVVMRVRVARDQNASLTVRWEMMTAAMVSAVPRGVGVFDEVVHEGAVGRAGAGLRRLFGLRFRGPAEGGQGRVHGAGVRGPLLPVLGQEREDEVLRRAGDFGVGPAKGLGRAAGP